MADKANSQCCPQCDKTFGDDENAVGCDGNCKKWYHKACAQLTTAEFNALAGKKGNLLWMCPDCRNLLSIHGINTSTPQDEKVKQAMLDSKTTQDEMKRKLDELSDSLAQRLSLILEAQIQQTDMISKLRETNTETDTSNKYMVNTHNVTDETGENFSGYRDSVRRGVKETGQIHSNIQQDKNGTYTNPWSAGDATRRSNYTQRMEQTGQRSKPIRGTKPTELSELQGGCAWLYVGGLHQNTEEEKLLSFLKNNGISGDLECERLETKGRNRAFKLGLPLSELDKVKRSEFWPQGITVRRYNFRQRNPGVEL